VAGQIDWLPPFAQICGLVLSGSQWENGHAALHKWQDVFILLASQSVRPTYAASQQDSQWLAEHGTVAK
jgi:hypothetical protein